VQVRLTIPHRLTWYFSSIPAYKPLLVTSIFLPAPLGLRSCLTLLRLIARPWRLKSRNQALRAELQRLHQDRTAVADQQALLERHEQTQVRFRTVFEHSPLGQKIIDSNLTIL
jgi:hypothetical protein